MIFVDTSAWFAYFVPNDSDHSLSKEWVQRNDQPLLPTDFVLDELLTLMKARKEHLRAIGVARRFFVDPPALLHFVFPDEFGAAAEIFCQFRDKEWSSTDCVSYVIIKQFSIKVAFAFDEHFRQFGGVKVVPELSTAKQKRGR